MRRWAATVGVAALLSALAVVFLVWPSQQFVDTRSDPYKYAGIARQMLREGFAAHGLTKREASLYPIAIAAIYKVAGERPLVVTVGQAAVFAGTCVLTFLIGCRLFNLRTGILAGLLLACNPLPLRYVADPHMETMLTGVVTLNVLTMIRFWERPGVGTGVLVGITAGVAALTKGVALVPPLVFGVGLAIAALAATVRGRSPRVRWPAILAFAAATALVIAPWTIRNYHVTGGRLVPIAPGLSDAFLRGYVFSRAEFALLRRPPYVDAENECNAWFRDICARAGTEFGRDEVLDEQILGAVARQMIVEQPVDTLRKTVVGLFTFWYQMTTPLTSLVAAGIALAAWTVAIPGLRRARRERRPAWLLIAPIVSMNVFIALLCSLGRYSMPMIPCLMVLAAFGIDTLMRRMRRMRRIRRGGNSGGPAEDEGARLDRRSQAADEPP